MGKNAESFKKGEMPKVGKQFSSEYQPDKEIWTEKEALRLFEDLIKWFDAENSNIFFEEFLFDNPELGERPGIIYEDLIVYLVKKFPSCLELYKLAQLKQKVRLQKFGTFDKINVGMSKFLLSAVHGLKEKTEIAQEVEIKRTTIKWGDQEIQI